MAEITRMSMNTMICNSRIFYETSSDDSDSEGSQKENSESNTDKDTFPEKPQEVKSEAIHIKEEPADYTEPSPSSSIKRVTHFENVDSTEIKPGSNAVKQEPATPVKVEQSFIDLDESLDINCMELLALKTPVKIEEDTDDLPSSQTKNNFKCLKRTLDTHRSSPYAKHRDMDEPHLPAKYRKLSEDAAKQRKPRECDPIVLERRQKQIDFGKNTIGYDNFTQMVPRTSRTNEHAMTPNKHKKYSRRAWDGLIKQWRIKLHSYDEYKEGEMKKDT